MADVLGEMFSRHRSQKPPSIFRFHAYLKGDGLDIGPERKAVVVCLVGNTTQRPDHGVDVRLEPGFSTRGENVRSTISQRNHARLVADLGDWKWFMMHCVGVD